MKKEKNTAQHLLASNTVKFSNNEITIAEPCLEDAPVVLCPVFLTVQEEREFNKAATKLANCSKRLALEFS